MLFHESYILLWLFLCFLYHMWCIDVNNVGHGFRLFGWHVGSSVWCHHIHWGCIFDIFGWSLQLLEGSGAKHDTRIAHHWSIVYPQLILWSPGSIHRIFHRTFNSEKDAMVGSQGLLCFPSFSGLQTSLPKDWNNGKVGHIANPVWPWKIHLHHF